MGKHKKNRKKKSKERQKSHKKSSKSSSEDTSSSEEWVESNATPQSLKSQASPPQKLVPDAIKDQDEWATNPALLACSSRDQLRQSREEKNNKNEQDKYMLDNLGQTERELNPYWKDGGCGLPEESAATVESLRQSHVTVGDQGTAWLRKALQRAKEQAQESGRSLAEVVAERWGSLEKLENMIAAAEERDKIKRLGATDSRRFSKRDESRVENHSISQRDRNSKVIDKKYYKVKESKKIFSKPRDSSEDSSDDERRRNKNKTERKDKIYISERDNLSKYRDRTDNNERRFKKNKGHSDEDSEKERKISKIQRNKETPHKKFTKPHSSSSSSEENKKISRNYKDRQYEQKQKAGSSYGGFSKPASSSDENESTYTGKRENSRDYSKDFDRSKPYEPKKRFVRPHHDSEEDDDYKSKSQGSKSRDYKFSYSSGKGWRKKVEKQEKREEVVIKNNEKNEDMEKVLPSNTEDEKSLIDESEPILTDKELNELAAKLVKAELLGNEELAEELKIKLSKAREAKAKAPKQADGSKEVVILTHTDAKGFTRPVSLTGPIEPSGGRRKGKKVETHAGGKRMRYFADDDKYSLQEMFQREKLNTVEDSNEVFAKLASKGIGRDESTRDMEDVFEESARVEESEERQKARERQRAVEQSRRTARTLDHCQWCLDSQHMLKHLIVAIGTTCYLCVPPYQSLTDDHCLIVPRTHTPCATQLDEDVWTEVQDFRKAVVQMFLSRDEDVVFFESARRLNQFPHMVLNCVPVPRETGDMAPIYFKKAIQECEQEWSNNKKLVELKGRDVRRAVPKGLPYFAVDFGMDSGYAHVIEDEQLFPQNFAQEIIGGMLDLDHSMWRKQRRQTFEEQSKKVIQLSKLWTPFDITKKT